MAESNPRGAARLSGVFPICTTPFTQAGELDVPALRRVAEHIIAGGAHGLVYPAIASEFQTLSERERRLGVETVTEAAAGRLPVVIGISADQAVISVRLAEEARDQHASAVMLMPSASSADEDLYRLCSEVGEHGEMPIILQNAPPPLGPALPVETVAWLIERCPLVSYVKEETPPCGHRITALLAKASDSVLGVFGGGGGRFVLDELARGVTGSMPACEFTSIHVAIYDQFRSGNVRAARRLFNVLLPILNFGSLYRTAATKAILFRMGVIVSPFHRDGNVGLDRQDHAELELMLGELAEVWPPAGARRVS